MMPPVARRLRLSLEPTSGGPLSWSEADRLFQLGSEVFGTLAIELDPGCREDDLPDLRSLGEHHIIVPELRIDAGHATARRLDFALGAGAGGLVVVGRAVPPASFSPSRLPLRFELELGSAAGHLEAWADLAAASGATQVRWTVGRAGQGCLDVEELARAVSRLDAARVPWVAHGVPHCLVERRGWVFGPRQCGLDLQDRDPVGQELLDSILSDDRSSWDRRARRLARDRDRRAPGTARLVADRLLGRVGYSPKVARPLRAGLKALNLVPGVSSWSRRRAAAPGVTPPESELIFPSATCLGCSLRRACGGPSREALQLFGGERRLRPGAGALIDDPLFFLRQDPPPASDLDRPWVATGNARLAETARATVARLGEGDEVPSAAYRPCGVPFDKMNGSINWQPLWERFCESTVLRRCTAPLTIRASFAGRARHIGFTFGPNQQIMCVPTAHQHRLTVHVADDGDYVLLRDGQETEPVHVPGRIHRAGRLPRSLEPRLAAEGIRDGLMTQEVLVWAGSSSQGSITGRRADVELSVIVVCTKYSRRLNLLVRSIGGQRQFDLSRAEVVVAYVPGLDCTEDILEGARCLWPSLNVTRVPFDERLKLAKGAMVNEAVRAASGRRVLITDADVILPPDTFFRLDRELKDAHFVSVEGRKMLDKQTTAELLAGLRDPVRDFDYLRDQAPGEVRRLEAKAVPIGFFQCVLRSHFGQVRYQELPHFEGADHRFSLDVRRVFGQETIMQGALVLHQDHSGSRWFGTDRHF